MEKINSESDLRGAIIQLENKKDEEGKMLKKEFHLAYESIKPVNIIKNSLKEVGESLELKESFLIAIVGISAGYLSRKLLVGASQSPMRKLLGAALVFGITNLVAKHPEVIKLSGKAVLKFFSRMLGTERHGAGNDEPGEIEYKPR